MIKEEFMAMILAVEMVETVKHAVDMLALTRASLLASGIPEDVVTDMINSYGEAYGKMYEGKTVEELVEMIEEKEKKHESVMG